MNLLTDIVPAAYRKYAYAAFALAGIVVAVLNIVQVDTGRTTDVLAYLGTALGLVAAGNTATTKKADPAPNQD